MARQAYRNPIAGVLVTLAIGVAPANATTPHDFDKTVISRLQTSKAPIFYSVCTYGDAERLVWIFADGDGIGHLMSFDLKTNERYVLRQLEVGSNGTALWGEENFGNWVQQKYASAEPGGPNLIMDFPDRVFRIALPGTDFIAAILGDTRAEPCEVQPKTP